ncbi:MAG: hypothetical protein SD837_12860 [Candidatus Electrothrix scaldis]|nr:MAG: hypothetical protein SD837_12860 [Candidatus Electrothrix sp. GW3-3]
MKKKMAILFFFTLITAVSVMANEEERHIHINGEHLDRESITLLDQIVGSKVEDGFYWLDMKSGEWGYEGNNQVQGIVTSIANSSQQKIKDTRPPRATSYINTPNGSAVIGTNSKGENCMYATVEGMTIKQCD